MYCRGNLFPLQTVMIRSRDKDSIHTIRSLHSRKSRATHKPHGSMFHRTGVGFTLLEWEFLTFFAPITLTLMQ